MAVVILGGLLTSMLLNLLLLPTLALRFGRFGPDEHEPRDEVLTHGGRCEACKASTSSACLARGVAVAARLRAASLLWRGAGGLDRLVTARSAFGAAVGAFCGAVGVDCVLAAIPPTAGCTTANSVRCADATTGFAAPGIGSAVTTGPRHRAPAPGADRREGAACRVGVQRAAQVVDEHADRSERQQRFFHSLAPRLTVAVAIRLSRRHSMARGSSARRTRTSVAGVTKVLAEDPVPIWHCIPSSGRLRASSASI